MTTPELTTMTPEQERIAQLESMIAALEQAKADRPSYPDIVHFYATLTVHTRLGPAGMTDTRIVEYGDEVVVDTDLLIASRDRFGRSFLDQTPDEQVRKYGQLMWAPGPWPEGKPRVEAGSLKWWAERDAKRAEVYLNIAGEQEQAERIRRINSYYGIQPTSYALTRYPV